MGMMLQPDPKTTEQNPTIHHRQMKPGSNSIDLIRQMAECDANYIRLLKLIPELRAFRNKARVRKAYFRAATPDGQGANNQRTAPRAGQPGPGDGPCGLLPEGKISEFCIAEGATTDARVMVEITVLESFRYTTTLEITQRPMAGRWLSNPVMQVRVYHDASTAEVTSYQNERDFRHAYVQPNPRMYQRDEKTQVNRFLGEWLTHCIEAGRCVKVPDIAFC